MVLPGNAFYEKKALLSLVLNHGEWSSSLAGWSFDSNLPVCDWDGVTCDDDGNGDAVVTEVDLSGRGLSGTVPAELGLLTELEVLNLKDNILDGSIPREVAELKKLVTLDLADCFLTGTLPQRFESPRLKNLLLANNAITGRFFQTDRAPHLQSVQEIRLENNLLTGTLHGPTLVEMPRLETLSLSDNDLSGLIPGDELGSLPELHYLYLDSNHFVGPLPTHLAQVGKASILELWLQDNALSGTVPASYVRFDQLHDFYIDGNKLTGELPPGLCNPEINADFFVDMPADVDPNYCDSVACPAGTVAFEGVYPCERCPGGEAARLKNRYLGQTGKCSDYSDRDVLRMFYAATTKGGPWTGVNDWDNQEKPLCMMTGITCDAHNRVIGIALKKRGLEGHIPDEIGHLSFLQELDVSDNNLMGFVPRDLQWTSLTRLDISGNKIRGMVPPLLCMMEELNGNGRDGSYHCDSIACPEGMYNARGYRHADTDEPCMPCDNGTPFIAQKVCTSEGGSGTLLQMAKGAKERMGDASKVGMGLGLGALVVIAVAILAMVVKRVHSNPRKKYEPGTVADFWERSDDQSEDEEDGEDTSADPYMTEDYHNQSQYKDAPVGGEVGVERDDASRASVRNATDLLSEHQNVSIHGRETFGNINRPSREAATSANAGAMQFSRQSHSSMEEIQHEKKKKDHSDLLDVPMIT